MFIEPAKISGQIPGPAFLDGDLFGTLSPAAREALRAVKREKEFAAGAEVFAAGEKPSAIYILARGEARIFRQGGALVQPAKTGEIFGLTEMLSNLPYEAGLKTLTACRFEYIRRASFLDFLQNQPAACFRLLEIVAANLQRLYRFLH
jgi:CRP-like cAMP-binding protein